MSKIFIDKLTAVPALANVEPNTIYAVSVGVDKLEIYMSNNAGDALRRMPNEADIQALIDASTSTLSGVEIVADIAERDGLNLTSNAMVIVQDAKDDSTVDAGAALYGYNATTSAFSKLSEFESLDVVLNWSAIQGGPSSTPTAIDNAVGNSHSHTNKTQLDALSQDSEGDLNYNGEKVANTYGQLGW